jgi:hypothetical protein
MMAPQATVNKIETKDGQATRFAPLITSATCGTRKPPPMRHNSSQKYKLSTACSICQHVSP